MDKDFFISEVERNFRFLADYGFQIEIYPYPKVVYLFGEYKIKIVFEKQELQADLALGKEGEPNSIGFNFLVAVFDREVGLNMPMPPHNLKTQEQISASLQTLAGEFQRFVDLKAFKSPGLWDIAAQIVRDEMEKRYPSLTWEELMERFDQCWDEGNYRYIANVFPTFAAKLDEQRRQRLAIAKERLEAGGKPTN